jgi:hypothetical protein
MEITVHGSKYTRYYFKGDHIIGVEVLKDGKWVLTLLNK